VGICRRSIRGWGSRRGEGRGLLSCSCCYRWYIALIPPPARNPSLPYSPASVINTRTLFFRGSGVWSQHCAMTAIRAPLQEATCITRDGVDPTRTGNLSRCPRPTRMGGAGHVPHWILIFVDHVWIGVPGSMRLTRSQGLGVELHLFLKKLGFMDEHSVGHRVSQ